MSTALSPAPSAQPNEMPAGAKANAKKGVAEPAAQPFIQPKFVIAGQADVTSPDAKLNDSAIAAGVGVGYESAQTVLNFFVRKGAESEIGPTSATDSGNYTSAYGASVLDPLSASYSFSLSGGYYPWSWPKATYLKPRIGLRLYLTASSAKWSHVSNGEVASTQAAPMGIGLCPLSAYSLSKLVNKMNAMVYTHACGVLRYVGGDFALLATERRESILGSDNKTFLGGELEFGVRIGTLALSARVFVLGERVGGLSNFRFIPSIAASAPLEFPLE